MYQELAGPRYEQWEALSQQTGITQVQVWLMQLHHGELMLMTLWAQNPQQILKVLVTSTRPFDCWLRLYDIAETGFPSLRYLAGGMPTSRLKALRNATSDS